jgi:hypothetical protein
LSLPDICRRGRGEAHIFVSPVTAFQKTANFQNRSRFRVCAHLGAAWQRSCSGASRYLWRARKSRPLRFRVGPPSP